MCKTIKKSLGMMAVLLALFLLFGMNMAVFALEVPVLGREGKLSVTMRDPETQVPVPGGTIALYRVADIQKEQTADFTYIFTGDFVGCNEKLDSLDAALARRLADYAETVDADKETVEVGSDGKIVFSGLKPGLFLLVQETAAEGYYTVNPFLVGIPLLEEDGSYTYDVDATPKMELLSKEPQPTPEPPSEVPENPDDATSSGGDGPQTGDISQLELWLTIAGISGIGAFVTCLLRRKSRCGNGPLVALSFNGRGCSYIHLEKRQVKS